MGLLNFLLKTYNYLTTVAVVVEAVVVDSTATSVSDSVVAEVVVEETVSFEPHAANKPATANTNNTFFIFVCF